MRRDIKIKALLTKLQTYVFKIYSLMTVVTFKVTVSINNCLGPITHTRISMYKIKLKESKYYALLCCRFSIKLSENFAAKTNILNDFLKVLPKICNFRWNWIRWISSWPNTLRTNSKVNNTFLKFLFQYNWTKVNNQNKLNKKTWPLNFKLL